VGQLTDRTQAPNTAKAGIAKSLQEEIGPRRGDVMTPGSSIDIIERDRANTKLILRLSITWSSIR